MSKIVFKTINLVVGCRHDRVYCWCKMQARRQKRRCLKCYRFEPHTHFERLKGLGGRPKTIWFVDMGDLFGEWVLRILEAARRYPGNTYMFLTKNPRRYHEFLDMFPENSLLGATIETNRDASNLSKAPSPVERFEAMLELNHLHKFVVVEPILGFDLPIFTEWMKRLNPIIYT